jgi:hypothetical protein
LFQYSLLITHLLESLPDHPILVPLPPQISQNIFHPDFLKPFTRQQTVDRLTVLLANLGWVYPTPYGNEDTWNSENKITDPSRYRKPTGITMISHSK